MKLNDGIKYFSLVLKSMENVIWKCVGTLWCWL